jgi:hypothetical protein
MILLGYRKLRDHCIRDYTFKDGVLSYAVPASAYGGGVVAYSLLRRVGP